VGTAKQCRWCTAFEGEKRFDRQLRDCCDSCGRMRWRDKCSRCSGPKKWKRCGECDPPPKGRVAVILLDESSDLERIVYRAPRTLWGGEEGAPEITILLDGKTIRVEDPIVVSLSRREFLRILC